ncbi:MAG: GAF domain-containing protein, partial [Brevundimonas sp.]
MALPTSAHEGPGLSLSNPEQTPWSETERLAALRAYDILDTDPEAAFDDIVALIARVCDAPIAVVNLIDAGRQWFKAEVGLGVRETPLDTSFCAHALLQQDGMVVPDATRDARFACNPLVTGDSHLRFYAGSLLKTAEGLPIGTLCVLDTEPRLQGLTDLQQQALETLARQVMTQLELRRALRLASQSQDAAGRAIAASNYIGVYDWDITNDRVVADARFAEMYGVDPAKAARGAPIVEFFGAIHADDIAATQAAIDVAMRTLGEFEAEYRIVVGDRERWLLATGQVYPDASGAPAQFAGVAVDITARKTVELELAQTVAALKQSEAGFRALADAMPQMVWS